MALAPVLVELEAPDDGEVTPEGDMLGIELALGVVVVLGLVLGVAMLGVVVLGEVVLVEAAPLPVDGVAGDAGVAGVADGSLTLPFEVVVVVAPVLFPDVSLCVVLDCPVLG